MKLSKLLPLVGTLLLLACSNTEKQAQSYYQVAETHFAANNYAAAKQQLDSLEIHFPKEYATLRQGKQLMRHIQLAEHRRNLAYVDSLMPLVEEEANKLKKDFYYEKDSLYQTVGDYVFKLQKLERNVQRCYLRAQTNELGNMQLLSLFYGKTPINHSHIKLTLNDDTYAQTMAIPYDGGLNYRFEDEGYTTEVITFKDGTDNGVIDFVTNNTNQRIKVTCLGGNSYIYYLDDQAKQSIAATYRLSLLLSELQRLGKERVAATKNIAYLEQRIAQKEAAATVTE